MSEWKGQTRGGVLGHKIFVWTLKYLGISFAYFLLVFVVIYFLFTSGKALRNLYNYFRKIQHFSLLKTLTGICQNYYIFGQVLIDRVAMLAGFQQKFTFTFEGEEYLRQMDNGGLVVSGHVGNWEIAGQMLNRLGKKINILIVDAERRQVKSYLDNVMNRNVHFIVIKDDFSHLAEIKNAFEKGEIIAMHGDRFIEGNKTVECDFMEKPARFPVGPANIAARFKVPISYVFAIRETSKHYHFSATPLSTVAFSNNLKMRDMLLKEAVVEYVTAFEAVVRKFPVHWFNYYDFWNLQSKNKPIEKGEL